MHIDNSKTPHRNDPASGPEEFNRRLAEAIRNTPMIEGLIDDYPRFRGLLFEALKHESMARLDASMEIMEALHLKDIYDFDMLEISYAVNCIEAKTPDQLDLTGPAYIDTMKWLTEIAAKWNAVAVPLKDALTVQMRKEFQNRIIVPEGQRIKNLGKGKNHLN